MSSRDESPGLRWDIHPSVVFQLGESLITDVVQALVELIKNAYDADANFANVTVDTAGGPGTASAFPCASGCITVEDDGEGMDLETLQRGWLTISNSLKRDAKRLRKATALRHRTPLGDKGLGRLGAQRLGYNLEVFTRPQDSPIEYHVAFSWRSFLEESSLSAVPIRKAELEPSIPHGTRLVISELREPDEWSRPDSLERLQTSLSRMISPYQEARDFVIAVTVNGRRLELAEITQQVRRAAEVRYVLDFDGTVLQVTGMARLDFFRPPNRSDWAAFARLVEDDGGQALLSFLMVRKQAKDLKLRKSSEPGWFVDFAFAPALTDVPRVAVVDGQPVNPGPFHAEIDSFDLGEEQRGAFDRTADFKRYIKSLSGVRVYRDGFGIRVDPDWLKLGAQWTSATSYYGLKPTNTLGFVALTARDNAQLEETTDREGFKSTPAYQNFYGLLQQFVGFTVRAHQFLRRGWIAFRNEHTAREAQVSSDTSSEQLLGYIGRQLAHTRSSRDALASASKNLDQAVQAAHRTITMPAREPGSAGDRVKELQAAIGTLEEASAAAQPVLSQVQVVLGELADLQGRVEVLVNREALQRDQLLLMYEAIGLGLTAEALSHEIRNVTDQLAHRSQQFRNYLKRPDLSDRRILAYVEHVQSSISALRRQLAHLAPSLRYVRERRERIDLAEAFAESAEFYRERWTGSPIEMHLVPGEGEFAIRMNRGKLVQVIDNLVLNSDYWLREDLRLGSITQGVITLELDRPFVRVHDNGRGIDPSVEFSLFEPFVTTKGEGQGRGLGLFIARQLLDVDGCTIDLLPRRNANGRLYVFRIDLTGALDAGG